ncbi:GNAT family N-acetyltransferase [Tianweitania sediminis]|uniref:GNAT family N-acetyltransferase n=1 Tax=Tianweitania sediminis TaxID=1502156 RepID=A0A8J7UHU7_9HYPH|nr:GNAT family N-acetyltransferase [Tianweitania sediminis]MBP0439579.1 GNAT family N-acetyltransferase [Tianweitania sediminis]
MGPEKREADVIRHATASDRFAVIRLLRDSHAAAGWTFTFQAARAEALFKRHAESVDGCCLVIGEPAQGVLMATAFDHPFGAGKMAKETVWFVAPDARGRAALLMLDAYEDWARSLGCAVAGMASLATNDVSPLYERRGYRAVETHFLKPL